MRLVLLGPPGAGKGTQARHLARRFGLAVISSGDIFRRHAAEGTELGRAARAYLDRGELVPDDVTIAMILQAIEGTDGRFVLDGFPRTVGQAEALQAELDARGTPLSAVLALPVGDEVAIRRISGRRTCPRCHRTFNVSYDPPMMDGMCDVCGGELIERTDEDEATVRRRLEVYRESTSPLLTFYSERGLLRTVDATGPEGEVTDRAVEALSGLAVADGAGGTGVR